MKKLICFILMMGIALPAYAQTPSCIDSSGNADSPLCNSSSQLSVDVAASSGISLDSEHAEDSAFTDEDVGTHLLGVRRDSNGAYCGTNGDYCSVSVNSTGAVYGIIDSRFATNAANNILKLEDTAHATGDAGVAMLGVRNNGLSTSFAADGDYMPFSLLATGALATAPVYDSGLAANVGLGKLEDAAHTTGDAGVAMFGVRRDAAGTECDGDDDYCALSVNPGGNLLVNVDRRWQAADSHGILKQEDAAHASGDAGVASLFLYQGSPSLGSTTTGDYINPIIGNYGQWVMSSTFKVTKEATPTIDTAAYAAGDQVGGEMTFSSTAYYSGAGVEIVSAVLTDEGAEGANMTLYLYDTNPTMDSSDQDAYDPQDASLVDLCCKISFTNHSAFADNGVSVANNTGCICNTASQALYGYLVADEVVTFDAADALTVRISVVSH
jgi:hypothetical protein